MKVTVKVCGITSQADADDAVRAGADALGFNFYRPSPRYISPEQAAAIRTDGVLRVGVFVDEAPEAVREIARVARLDTVQLHGSEAPADYTGLRVWKAYRVRAGWTLPDSAGAEAVLLDGPAPGTGESFDWSLARNIGLPFLLAGGLGPDNVADAIRQVQPWGVDACSKLESAPGVKDPEKVARFVQAARMATI